MPLCRANVAPRRHTRFALGPLRDRGSCSCGTCNGDTCPASRIARAINKITVRRTKGIPMAGCRLHAEVLLRDNPAEDAEAAAMRTAGLGGPWTLPAPWTPRTRPPPSLLVMTLRTDKRRRACARIGLTRYSQPLPLAGFQTFGDTLRSGRRRIHETTIERQDASAIHRLTPRRSCKDDRDGARTREQAHSARLR